MIQTSNHQSLLIQNQALTETHTQKHLNKERTLYKNHR